MLVLNLFLVYVTICMAIREPGHCAQKNILRGLKTRDIIRTQAGDLEGEFSMLLEDSRISYIK